MGWITAWVRQIAIVVMLAGVAELVLPRTHIKGYVRVVTGLLVMLTILEPVIQLLGHQVIWAQLEESPTALKYPTAHVAVENPELHQQTRRLTLETYRKRVSEEIMRLLSRIEAVEITNVTVDIETRSDEPDYGALLAVGVFLRPAEYTGSEIKPVQPILLDSGGEQEPRLEWPAGLKEARQEIYDLLRLHFDVARNQVQLMLVSDG